MVAKHNRAKMLFSLTEEKHCDRPDEAGDGDLMVKRMKKEKKKQKIIIGFH